MNCQKGHLEFILYILGINFKIKKRTPNEVVVVVRTRDIMLSGPSIILLNFHREFYIPHKRNKKNSNTYYLNPYFPKLIIL